MKRYITYDPYAESIGSVTGIYVGAIPVTIIGGIETEYPTPPIEVIPGMTAALRINIETGELYYDYEKEITVASRVSDLEETNNQLNEELGNLLMENAADKATITELNETLGDLLMQNASDKATITDLNDTVGGLMLEVAALKGGVS